MSSSPSALLSATFYEPGHDHLVELVHQRDGEARRRLASLAVELFDPAGASVHRRAVDPNQEILDLDTVAAPLVGSHGRLMVLFDARYDERIFPYRPHHYAYLHRRGASAPPLYYAVNAVLGGVPDRIGATGINNFESYLFSSSFSGRYSVMLGNVSRFAPARAQVFSYHGGARSVEEVLLPPKAHREIALAPEREGHRLDRVEVKALFRLASYVVGRHAAGGELMLFDHMFAYVKPT